MAIADDVLRCTTERQVPQAQAVAAVTSAIMAQLDGEREVVIKLTGEALHVADEVSTRQWRQWARSLQWWAGEGMEEPELPGPLLRPYFEMLLADDLLAGVERAGGLLDDALDTARTSGEQFCEAEILRLGAGAAWRGRRVEQAGRDYQEAVRVARSQGARMLDSLWALTDWLGLPGAPDHVRVDLEASVAEAAEGGPSRGASRGPTSIGVNVTITWDDAFLDSLRTQADPDADKVIAGLFSGTKDASSAFRALVVQQHEVADPAKAFLEEKPVLPAWVDSARVAAGQECFARWGSHVFTALYAAALPSAYACWRGVPGRRSRPWSRPTRNAG